MRQYVARPGQECKSELIIGAELERVRWTAWYFQFWCLVQWNQGSHQGKNGAWDAFWKQAMSRQRKHLIDRGMTLARHVNHISGVCLFQLRQLRIIRRSLTSDTAHALVRALIHTHIDSCNGLLASCPRYLTDKLQVVHAPARLVLQLPYRSSVSEAMHQQLHWLDVVDRVNYKFGLLVYKCLHGLAPGYLSDQCIPASTFAGRANTRSSSRLDRLLYVPRTKTKTLGPRGLYYASSAVWNSLPVDLRDPGLSLHSFRTKLKSHFFIVDWFVFPFFIHVLYYYL